MPLCNLIVLYTHDVPKMLKFYQTLGLDFVEEQHGKGPVHFAAQSGEMVLEIYPTHQEEVAIPKASGTIRLGFRLENLPDVLAQLAEEGFKPKNDPKMTSFGLHCVMLDPDGRSVDLVEAK